MHYNSAEDICTRLLVIDCNMVFFVQIINSIQGESWVPNSIFLKNYCILFLNTRRFNSKVSKSKFKCTVFAPCFLISNYFILQNGLLQRHDQVSIYKLLLSGKVQAPFRMAG